MKIVNDFVLKKESTSCNHSVVECKKRRQKPGCNKSKFVYYIQCENCNLKTDTFTSCEVATKIWNKLYKT